MFNETLKLSPRSDGSVTTKLNFEFSVIRIATTFMFFGTMIVWINRYRLVEGDRRLVVFQQNSVKMSAKMIDFIEI